MKLMEELVNIQFQLNAPKEQTNNFGHYRYRSAEDVLAAVKPLLKMYGCVIVLSDEIVEVGQPCTIDETAKTGVSKHFVGTRIYVKATATITNSAGQSVKAQAFAREELSKPGMDAAQVTGSASSYARKYALCGLLAIDGENDPDSGGKAEGGSAQNGQPQQAQASTQAAGSKKAQATTQAAGSKKAQATTQVKASQQAESDIERAAKQIGKAASAKELKGIYDAYPALQKEQKFLGMLTARRKELGI